jgi:hypothetical protein
MTTDELLNRQRKLLAEWPLGTMVWHRADGRRGVLMGVFVLIDGEVGFRVDYGAGGWASEKAGSLQASKPNDDEGEEWKERAHE